MNELTSKIKSEEIQIIPSYEVAKNDRKRT